MALTVSVILPTINEEQGIGPTIDAIKQQIFKKNNWDLQLIIIDGGSQDRTREIAKSKGATVLIEKRKGYGRAYKTGFAQATGDIIVTGDADATYPFEKIHEYIQQLLDNNLDFITTDRFADLGHGSMSVKHYFGNWVLSTALQVLFHVKVKDSQSGMWIFRKKALQSVQPLEAFHDGMPFSEEIKIEMFSSSHLKVKEIPSTLHARLGEVKLESFGDGKKNLLFLFKKRVTPRRKKQ